MLTNLFIIAIVGLMVGFILSVPAGGSISFVIFTNALKGRTRYCNLVSIGASLADFTFVFISIFGLTKLYSLYQPYIPYILFSGSFLIIYLSVKLYRSKFEFDENAEATQLKEKDVPRYKNGFLTGLMLGFLNPGLFMSWMTSSFIVFTILTSFGFDGGGLDKKMSDQLNEIHPADQSSRDTSILSFTDLTRSKLLYQNPVEVDRQVLDKNYPLYLSIVYALCISLGSITWFYYITYIIAKFRNRIKTKIIHLIIHVLGLALFVLGLFLGFKGLSMLM
ncbi:MAG: LysE family transporter [Saprospiraceae bacterium]